MVGKTFNLLTVISILSKGVYQVKCICGKIKVLPKWRITSGHTKSCGKCARLGNTNSVTHGERNTRLYRSWANMHSRCTNKNRPDYRWYGAKGIKVCKRWAKYENFKLDMGISTSNKHTLDRINSSNNYCKANCRWATQQEQVLNCSSNIWITYKNKKRLLVDWAKDLHIKRGTLANRIFDYNWTIERAFTTPVRKRL